MSCFKKKQGAADRKQHNARTVDAVDSWSSGIPQYKSKCDPQEPLYYKAQTVQSLDSYRFIPADEKDQPHTSRSAEVQVGSSLASIPHSHKHQPVLSQTKRNNSIKGGQSIGKEANNIEPQFYPLPPKSQIESPFDSFPPERAYPIRDSQRVGGKESHVPTVRQHSVYDSEAVGKEKNQPDRQFDLLPEEQPIHCCLGVGNRPAWWSDPAVGERKGSWQKNQDAGRLAGGSLPILKPALVIPMCQIHKDKKLELFCTEHQQPVCILCASSAHHRCKQMRKLKHVLQNRIEKLEGIVERMKVRESLLAQQRRDVEDKLMTLHTRYNPLAENMHEVYSNRSADYSNLTRFPSPSQALIPRSREELNALRNLPDRRRQSPIPKSKVDRIMIPKTKRAHIPAAESFAYMPQTLLNPQLPLGSGSMAEPLQDPNNTTVWIRLDVPHGSSSNALPTLPTRSVPELRARQKNWSNSSVQRNKPYGAALASLLRVGDRVKRSLAWMADSDTVQLGTVTAIPSARIATCKDSTGLVDVMWDAGAEGCYRMGRFNHYDLELA